jgi:UDP-hydrolysing UDP-N-acetyl-D-glucosamine 2-epimerase
MPRRPASASIKRHPPRGGGALVSKLAASDKPRSHNRSTDNSFCQFGSAHCGLQRIACISTSRADAGIYRPLLGALADQSDWQISCLAGGTHLSEAFGHTIDELAPTDRVELTPVLHFVSGDRALDVAETSGRAVIEFSKALAAARPDLVFVLGDRTEMLAAALAAVIHGIPIAHLHGGERTAGAYDDNCRHAITKLAHVHFAALPEYAERIASMGEEDWRIHTVGAPALDDLVHFEPLPVGELSAAVGLDFSRPTWVIAFYPETLSADSPAAQVEMLLAALYAADANLLILGTNADIGYKTFAEAYQAFADQQSNVKLMASLSKQWFWSCLAHAQMLIGNSSAGIIEAASFKLPVVNIGDRQAGRIRPSNVIDTACHTEKIADAVNRAISFTFRNGLASLTNPYGDGQAAARVVIALRSLPDRQTLLRKA